MNRVSRGPSTKIERTTGGMFREANRLIGDKRTIVYSPTDETSEGERGVEDTVGGIRQSDVLNTTSSQVGYGREHPDGGEAKSTGTNQRKGHRTRRLEKGADQVIPTNTTWVVGDLSTGPWVSKPTHLKPGRIVRTCTKQEAS